MMTKLFIHSSVKMY